MKAKKGTVDLSKNLVIKYTIMKYAFSNNYVDEIMTTLEQALMELGYSNIKKTEIQEPEEIKVFGNLLMEWRGKVQPVDHQGEKVHSNFDDYLFCCKALENKGFKVK